MTFRAADHPAAAAMTGAAAIPQTAAALFSNTGEANV